MSKELKYSWCISGQGETTGSNITEVGMGQALETGTQSLDLILNMTLRVFYFILSKIGMWHNLNYILKEYFVSYVGNG